MANEKSFCRTYIYSSPSINDHIKHVEKRYNRAIQGSDVAYGEDPKAARYEQNELW